MTLWTVPQLRAQWPGAPGAPGAPGWSREVGVVFCPTQEVMWFPKTKKQVRSRAVGGIPWGLAVDTAPREMGPGLWGTSR